MKLAIFRNKTTDNGKRLVRPFTVHRLSFTALLLLAVAGSCTKYNDSEVWDTLYNLTLEQQQQAARLAALEAWVNMVNENISALQTIVDALQDNDYITGVTPFDAPAPGGYYIDFNKRGRKTIWNGKDGENGKDGKDGENGKDGKDGENGKDGKDGENGKDGKDGENGKDGKDGENGKDGKDGENGKDGKDGKDGETPHIGVKLDNGIYYWTLNDEWLTDSDGNKIPAIGADGKDGKDGADGKDGENGKDGKNGATVAIGSDGYWYICPSGTCTETSGQNLSGVAGWTNTNVKAQGQDGANGITPQLRINSGTNEWEVCTNGDCTHESDWSSLGVNATGPQGNPGANGNPGATVAIGSDGYWYICSSGTCTETSGQNLSGVAGWTNTNVKAQGQDGANGITPQLRVNTTTNEWEVCINGDCTHESDWSSLGVNATGPQGNPGNPGADGNPGATVAIGSDGYWYICPSGTCTETSGQNLSGVAGWTNTNVKAQGQDGANGITPQLRINTTTNEWEVCVNGDCTHESDWSSLGINATGPQGNPGNPGADGNPGATVAIGSDGYWYICPSGTCTETSGQNLSGVAGWTPTGVNAEGQNGADGATVAIGSDGYWYICSSGACTETPPGAGWTNTNVKAQGQDGANGITPQLRINTTTNEWEVCINGDCTNESDWSSLGVNATGPQGNPGNPGADGNPGATVAIGSDGYWYICPSGTCTETSGQNLSGVAGWTNTNVIAQGQDGANGITPQLRVNTTTNEWEVCVNGDCTHESDWSSLGINATGPQGNPGNPGADGNPGTTVAIGSDGYWYICPSGTCTETSGQNLSGVAGWTNTNVKAQGQDGANGITPQLRVNTTTNEWEVCVNGDCTHESDWSSLGVNATGPQGNPGNPGANGKDGVTVAIGSDGYWYICSSGTCTGTPPVAGWTNTNVKAQGQDGTDGTNGTNGITPQLRINTTTEMWEMCITGNCASEGGDWTSLGVKATGTKGDKGDKGDSGDAVFAPNGVDDSPDDYVEFTLADLSTIRVPKYRPLGIDFTQPDKFAPGASAPITYTLTGNVQTVKIMNMPQGWTATNNLKADKTGGTFTVTPPPAFFYGNQSGEAVIFVSDGAERTIFEDVILTGAHLWTDITQITAAAGGGSRSVAVTSNGGWTATASAGAWCTLNPASGTNSGNLTVTATANTGLSDRSATVTLTDGFTTVTIPVTQRGNRPPNAASERTWAYGGLTWSDYINVAACNKAGFSASTSTPDCLSYTKGANTYYYYNGKYVETNGASLLCPAPWRVPTDNDFIAFSVASIGGSVLSSTWGLPDHADAERTPFVANVDNAFLWSATKSGTDMAYLTYGWSSVSTNPNGNPKLGMAVRCVHN